MAQVNALMALGALGLSSASFHEPFHANGAQRPIAITERSDQNPPQLEDMIRQDGRTCRRTLVRTRGSRSIQPAVAGL